MLFKNNLNCHFIIASPRSGTTWLSKMLNAHPNTLCVERRLFGDYADFVKDQNQIHPRLRVTLDKYVNSLLLHHGLSSQNKTSLTKALINTIIKEERNISGKAIVVDKITPYLNTSNTVLNQINTYFPKSKLIFLVRDGRDVLTSGVFHWFNKQHQDVKLNNFEKQRRALYLENGKELERFFQDKEIKQWANEWLQPLQIIESAKKQHDVKIIHYEALLEKPEIVLAECFKFLKVKLNQEILNKCVTSASFKNMSQGREKGQAKHNAHIRKGIAGDWKNYFIEQDGKLFHDIAGEMLLKFGYEKNNNWFERLR
ncbi:sulfotransferase domain-containing protein [Hyunsoonleella aestuarii]|uniref:Sulfotransferase domain-containing protein n=1 Tax=Hyunsoonleella aestuarii TaxID=912802 RepID=A0ABP8E7K2_9FLAO|nr:sulfotransferase domain-containing protein [Hyunsoonleella aestuarii]